MPIWVDGCCIMRSPIAESGRSGDTTNTKALCRAPANLDRLMGDIDQNQFQTQQPHDVANEAEPEQVDAENTASQLHNNNVNQRRMNEVKWTKEKN